MAESGGAVMIGYMIKGVNDKLQGYHDFQYPKKGEVVAQDWNTEPSCEGGIFGCTEGAWGYNFTSDSNFLVLSFEKGTEVKIDSDKIKVPKAKVLKVFNDLQKAIDFFEQKSGLTYCGHQAIKTSGDYATQTAGYSATQKAGYYSTQTAGSGSYQKAGFISTQTARDWSTQTAGNGSTQTAGDWSTQTSGGGSTQTAGDRSIQTARDWSTQKAGSNSTQTAENESTQKAGDYSTQKAGYYSTQKAGFYACQTAGDESTQTAGEGSTQTAGDGSTSVLHGRIGYCKHKGKVLQVVWHEGECFTELRDWDGKKYKLEVIDNKLTVEECV
jgi:hypothetical protein